MTCDEFLAGYSEYLDDLLDESAAARYRAHLDACRSCARYDRVLRRGLEALRELPPVLAEPGFRQRLGWRLRPEPPRAVIGAGTMAAAISVPLAAAVALVLWIGGRPVDAPADGEAVPPLAPHSHDPLPGTAAWQNAVARPIDAGPAWSIEFARFGAAEFDPVVTGADPEWWAGAQPSVDRPAALGLPVFGASAPGPHMPLVIRAPLVAPYTEDR